MKKSEFGSNGDSLIENNLYLLRIISEQDRENYIETCRRTSSTPAIYKVDGFDQYMFDHASDDSELNCSIIEKATGRYCGYCNLRNMNEDKPEIGISLLPEYQRKGIGYQMLQMLMRLAADRVGVYEFTARVYNDNTGSRRLMEKLGAVENGREPSEFAIVMQKLRKQAKDLHIEEAVKKDELAQDDERCIIVYTIQIASGDEE